MTIPATKWFDEIFLSDFSKKNIEAQKKWLARESDSYDWQYYFVTLLKKMGASKYLILLPDLIVLFGPRYFSPNVPSVRNNVKVVICGKYKNLNKIIKN